MTTSTLLGSGHFLRHGLASRQPAVSSARLHTPLFVNRPPVARRTRRPRCLLPSTSTVPPGAANSQVGCDLAGLGDVDGVGEREPVDDATVRQAVPVVHHRRHLRRRRPAADGSGGGGVSGTSSYRGVKLGTFSGQDADE